jgi:hypothetical protein
MVCDHFNCALAKKLAAVITEAERARFEAELERIAQMNDQQSEVYRNGRDRSDSLNLTQRRCNSTFMDLTIGPRCLTRTKGVVVHFVHVAWKIVHVVAWEDCA